MPSVFSKTRVISQHTLIVQTATGNGALNLGMGVEETKSKGDSLKHQLPMSVTIVGNDGKQVKIDKCVSLWDELVRILTEHKDTSLDISQWKEPYLVAWVNDGYELNHLYMTGHAVPAVDFTANMLSFVARAVTRTIALYETARRSNKWATLDEDAIVCAPATGDLVKLFTAAAAGVMPPTILSYKDLDPYFDDATATATAAVISKMHFIRAGHHIPPGTDSSTHAIFKFVKRAAEANPNGPISQIWQSGDKRRGVWVMVHGFDTRIIVNMLIDSAIAIDAGRYSSSLVRPIKGMCVISGVEPLSRNIAWSPTLKLSTEIRIRWDLVPVGYARLSVAHTAVTQLASARILLLIPNVNKVMEMISHYNRIRRNPIAYSECCAFLTGGEKAKMTQSIDEYGQVFADLAAWLRHGTQTNTMKNSSLLKHTEGVAPTPAWAAFLEAFFQSNDVDITNKGVVSAVLSARSERLDIADTSVTEDSLKKALGDEAAAGCLLIAKVAKDAYSGAPTEEDPGQSGSS